MATEDRTTPSSPIQPAQSDTVSDAEDGNPWSLWMLCDRRVGRFQRRMRWAVCGDVIWPDWRLGYRS